MKLSNSVFALSALATSQAKKTDGAAASSTIEQILSDMKAELDAIDASGGDPDAIPTGAGKSLAAGWANSMVNSINTYGCWCYFQDDHGKGKGQAQNAVDAQCKILHDGYSCILMDADDENDPNCVPWDVDFVTPTGLGWWSKTGDDAAMQDALRKECSKKNRKKGSCAQRSCIVEGYFSINLFKLLTSGVKYDPKLKHQLGKFDPKTECVVKKGPFDAEKQCCGIYPIRFPFKYIQDRRECCGTSTYNAEFLQCCPGDEVKVTCF